MSLPYSLAGALAATLLAGTLAGCQPPRAEAPASPAVAAPTDSVDPLSAVTGPATVAPTAAAPTAAAPTPAAPTVVPSAVPLPTATPTAEALTRRGAERLQRADYQGALDDLSRALAANPNLAEALAGRGIARGKLGDKAGALDDLTRALALNPNAAEAYWNRGELRSEQGDKLAAIEDYNRALALNASYVEAVWSRGAARSALGDHRGALEDYNRALALNPSQPTIYWNRGLERYELGDALGALEDYSRAIQLDPSYANAYWNRGVVRSNQSDRAGGLADLQYAAKLFFDQGNMAYYYWALDGIRAAQENSAALARSPSLAQPATASGMLEDAAALVKRYVVHVRSSVAAGSGSSLGGGWVLTSAHVVAGAEGVSVRFADGREGPATVVRVDAARDLALLQTVFVDEPTATLGDARALRSAERLLAVGYPRTDVLDLQEPSVTSGIFSGLRQIDGVLHVQTDTPTNPGNSGGPLADSQGRLVGVVRGNVRDAVGLNVAVASGEIEAFLQGSGPAAGAARAN